MRPGRVAKAVLLAALLVGGTARGRSRDEEQARGRIEAAEQALGARNPGRAVELLEASYRLSPSPDALLLLALAAQQKGLVVEAQDLARRGLADPTLETSSPLRSRTQPILDGERRPSGEVYVQGPGGALVRADGRLVGVLPLALPLLLPAGEHTVELEGGGKPLRGQLGLRNGHAAEIRFSRESGAVLVTLPPGVILLPRLRELPPAVGPQLLRAVEQAVRRAQLGLINTDVALAEAPEARGCLDTPACQAKLAQKNDSDYVLTLDVSGPPPKKPQAFALRLMLLDATVGEAAAAEEGRCEGCTAPQLSARLTQALDRVFTQGAGRARGTLNITSIPSGALVYLDRQPLGRTPLRRPTFAGRKQLELRLSGHAPEPVTVDVADGGEGKAEVTLRPQAGATENLVAPAPIKARPRWRLAVGGAALGVGVLLAAFGTSALAIHDTCIDDIMPPVQACGRYYDTVTPGAALLAPGLALTVAGVVLLALPPGR